MTSRIDPKATKSLVVAKPESENPSQGRIPNVIGQCRNDLVGSEAERIVKT
jgi:hypothetical protein